MGERRAMSKNSVSNTTGAAAQKTVSVVKSTGTCTSPAKVTFDGDTDVRHKPLTNGHRIVFQAPETNVIVKKLFFELLKYCGVENGVIKTFEVSGPALKRYSKYEMICKITELTTQYIQDSDQPLERFIEELECEVQDSTMYAEFRMIAESLFSDGVNFGRVLSFLRFSAAYAVRVYRKGLKKAVDSVEAWTLEVIQHDLGEFFMQNNGWAGYADYLEPLLRAQRKSKQAHTPGEPKNVWDTVLAFGAVAAGLGAAYGLRQVFS